MRILIVDDSGRKIDLIRDVIKSVDACDDNNVLEAKTAYDAGDVLKREYVDLLIVDVVLPLRSDCDAAGDGGVTFVREILRKPELYNQPGCILGMTAYVQSQSRWRGQFESCLGHLILVDESAEEWRDHVKRRVQHIAAQSVRVERVLSDRVEQIKGSYLAQLAPDVQRRNILLSYDSYAKLSESYSGVWGTKVFWLALLTLLPLFVSFKIHTLSLRISPATVLYVPYHLTGIYLWGVVRHARNLNVRPPPPHAFEGLVKIERIHHIAGNVVMAMIALTVLVKAQMAMGDNVYSLNLPPVIGSVLGAN